MQMYQAHPYNAMRPGQKQTRRRCGLGFLLMVGPKQLQHLQCLFLQVCKRDGLPVVKRVPKSFVCRGQR